MSTTMSAKHGWSDEETREEIVYIFAVKKRTLFFLLQVDFFCVASAQVVSSSVLAKATLNAMVTFVFKKNKGNTLSCLPR